MPKKQKDILVKDRQKNDRPKRYKVVFYNDDFTPMNLVTSILVEVFMSIDFKTMLTVLPPDRDWETDCQEKR